VGIVEELVEIWPNEVCDKNLFCQETDTGIFPIQSWAHFEQQFRSQFFLVNAEADAINALEGSSYYQGNWTVYYMTENTQLII